MDDIRSIFENMKKKNEGLSAEDMKVQIITLQSDPSLIDLVLEKQKQDAQNTKAENDKKQEQI